MSDRTPPGIDIGFGHSFVWLTAKAGKYDIPDILKGFNPDTLTEHNMWLDRPEEGEPFDVIGIMERHPKPEVNPDYPEDWYHGGAVYFVHNANGNNPVWTVDSVNPLDISPSVLCGCGSHGFIKQGKWVQA